MSETPLDRLLRSRFVVPATAVVTLLIGLAFIFVGAPLPWGWYGIDHYHDMAIELAEGRGFQTLDVPWGYAYFLAVFYRVFGPTPVPPLVAQAALNALIPIIVYAYARRATEFRVAVVAAMLVSVLSFNTIYVSTESTDAVCTVVFMVMVWVFVEARSGGGWWKFALCGVLGGVAAQFRPNLVLLPLFLSALHWVMGPRSWRRIREGAIVVFMAALLLAPWTIRNYRLTGEFIPTSTHGGVQLWYGTLQTGPYLQSRAYNPRTLFASPVFEYSSLLHATVLINAFLNCAPGVPESVEFVFRTADQQGFQTLPMTLESPRRYGGALPPLPNNTRIDYYVAVRWPASLSPLPLKTTPLGGAADPLVYFISDDHTGDLDTGDRLLDVFDVARLLRHLAWNEPVRASGKLDLDRNGRLDEADLRANLLLMLRGFDRGEPPVDRLRSIVIEPEVVRAQFVDGSEMLVPRQWQRLFTDLQLGSGVAETLIAASHRFTEPLPEPKLPLEVQCLGPGELAINAQFYRTQPHQMRRYTALALDNIRRAPGDYAKSVLYRAVRLFVIQGTDDPNTAQQFTKSRILYAGGTVLSGLYLVLSGFGAWLGVRRNYAVLLPLALIAYIPMTIAFVLTNMRYTLTVQPLLLMFVAVTLVEVLKRLSWLSEEGHG